MFRRREIACASRCAGVALVALLGVFAGNAMAAAPGKPVAFLTGPNTGNPLAIARGYLEQNKQALGLSSQDIAGALVTDQYTSSHNGVTHIYMRQQYQGLEVHSANININIAADGSVINVGNRFVPDIDTAINTTAPFLNRGEAISAAAYSLGLDPARGPVSRNPIAPRLVYQPVAKGSVRLAWELEIYTLDALNWWSMRVDAVTGAVLDQNNYVTRDSYEVFAAPVESPSHGQRSIVSAPADPIASPSGWLSGTCTKGNNVDAYLDTNNSN
jgi:extracellular elastinolytic metalloproteinase